MGVIMNVLISGGSGFIGSALAKSLLASGHQAWILSRNPEFSASTDGINWVKWDGRTSQGWLDIFERMDAVVNLAGETVGSWPWNEKRKQKILESRLLAGQAISMAYRLATRKPPVLIQSSGIGYYGPLGEERVDETQSAGGDFIAQVARQWENSSQTVESYAGVRRVIIRTSLVLDAQRGVLPLMALPVKFFAGGPLGSGKQGVSWIHIDDEVAAIRFLLEHPLANGVFNLSAPLPVSNADFVRMLARTLGRPYWIPAPAFVLRLALGQMSTLLLDGQFVIPKRLQELGFKFQYEDPEKAFKALYAHK
jgi:uncharacterized protein (TIGR01777 family)